MADIEEIPLEPEAPTERGGEIQNNETENQEDIAPVSKILEFINRIVGIFRCPSFPTIWKCISETSEL